MTPKISLITAVAVAALVFGAPTAFGEGRLAGSPEPALATPDPMIEDGFAQAVAASLALGAYRDAFERAVAAGQLDLSTFRNAFDRAAPVTGLGSNLSTYRDAFERAVPIAAPTEAPTISSGRDFEWPQIGIGFGIGIVSCSPSGWP